MDDKKPIVTDEIRAALKPEFDALEAKAREAGHVAGKAEGLDAGVKGERARIIAIQKSGIAGHDELAAKAIADGMSHHDFLIAQTDAENAKRSKKVADIREDGKGAAAAATIVPDPANPSNVKKAPTQAEAVELGKKAEIYREEQRKAGITISATEAVEHVYKVAGVPLK